MFEADVPLMLLQPRVHGAARLPKFDHTVQTFISHFKLSRKFHPGRFEIIFNLYHYLNYEI
jgi:hypothetical protein